MNETVLDLINQADLAIKEERFDDLMEFYMDDAILVVKPGLEVSEYAMERKATYVYRKINGKWLCAIDNSYGTSLLDM